MAKITWTFKNEEGTNLNRYIATNVSTGEKITFDLLRGGNISVVGTPLNAENLNALITAINACYDLISSSEKDTTYTLSKNGNAIRLTSSDGTTNDVTLNKSDVGLGNVDNTSDMDKPISTAQQQGLNKPLYNLGAFDTISGNVITRQTRYVDLIDIDWIWEANDLRWRSANKISDIYYTNVGSYVPEIKSAKYPTISISQQNQSTSVIGITTYEGYIYLRNGSSTEKPSGIIQYHSTTISYTEEIIEGQPLITLDSQGSQWLRSEWEKGLNLFDMEYMIGRTATRCSYSVAGSTISVEPTENDSYIISSEFYLEQGMYWIKAECSVSNALVIYLYDDTGAHQLSDSSFIVDKSKFVAIRIGTPYQSSSYTVSNIMLNEGDNAYPYTPYNSKEHITNYEADFLKEESLKSANLLQKTNDQSYDLNFLENNTSYTLSFSLSGGIGVTLVDGTSKVVDRGLPSGYHSFTFIKNSGGNASLWFSDVSKVSNIMLNEGSTALPYQEYNGSIVREKQLKELDNKKANKSDVYTKNETDNKIDSIVAGETGLTNYYTKSETDNKLANKVPITRTVNGKALSTNITLSASDVGARPNTWTPSKTDVGLENVDNTSDSNKNVASAKVLKNNDVYDFDISSGITPYSIDLNDNHVYLIYNDHWSFVMRVKRPNDNNYSQSTVCINENNSKPVWFTYQGTKLKLKTTKVVNSNTFVVVEENYNGKFNYKLLATD